MSHHPTPLIAFYRGQATDHQGRYINDIWALSHFWLEHTHDYIQWLFPIPEVGRFNHFAPRLTDVEREVFQDDSALREKQRVSLDVMLSFLGLTRDGITITAQPSLNIRDHIWCGLAQSRALFRAPQSSIGSRRIRSSLYYSDIVTGMPQ